MNVGRKEPTHQYVLQVQGEGMITDIKTREPVYEKSISMLLHFFDKDLLKVLNYLDEIDLELGERPADLIKHGRELKLMAHLQRKLKEKRS